MIFKFRYNTNCVFVCLQENPTVQILDMTDNEIGPKGALYLAEMLTDNRIITDLVSSLTQLQINIDITSILNLLNMMNIINKSTRVCRGRLVH